MSVRVPLWLTTLGLLASALCLPVSAAPNDPVAFEPVTAALDGSALARAGLLGYLAGPSERLPVETVALATSVIDGLAGRAAFVDFHMLQSAIDRVVDVSSVALSNARIYHLGIEEGYRPVAPVLALDFGPVGGSAPGFERVEAGDPRLRGRGLEVVRGNGQGGVLGSGILGIQRIALALPEDAYRIVLFTRRSGRGGLVPFGRAVAVNGVRFRLALSASERWVGAVMLPSVAVGFRTADGAGNPIGAVAGEFRFVNRMRRASDTGGAMIVEGWAAGGKLVIELISASGRPTYLTGLLVEPASKWSDLVLGVSARNTVITLHQRLGFQEQILAAAAKVIRHAAPAQARSVRFFPPRLPTDEAIGGAR